MQIHSLVTVGVLAISSAMITGCFAQPDAQNEEDTAAASADALRKNDCAISNGKKSATIQFVGDKGGRLNPHFLKVTINGDENHPGNTLKAKLIHPDRTWIEYDTNEIKNGESTNELYVRDLGGRPSGEFRAGDVLQITVTFDGWMGFSQQCSTQLTV